MVIISLNIFPPEVIARILDMAITTNVPMAPILLWQCGDRQLNEKLQHGGCRSLSLVQRSDWNLQTLLPQLVTTGVLCQHLHELVLVCGFPLSPNVLPTCALSLQSLSITCPNLAHVMNGVDYNKHWPLLQHVKLAHNEPMVEPKGLLNFLPQLPPTVTELRMPKFEDASLVQVLQSLPPDLQTLYYAQATDNTELLLTNTSEQQVLQLLSTQHRLQHLRLGDTMWTLYNHETAPFLPPHLRELAVYYNPSMSLALPRHLHTLVIRRAWSLYSDTSLRLPPGLTKLALHGTNPHFFNHNNDQLFTFDQWRAFLPPNLTIFRAVDAELPIRWSDMTHKVCIWPSTLQTLLLARISSSCLKWLSLPPTIRTVQITSHDFDHFSTEHDQIVMDLFSKETTPHLESLHVNHNLCNRVIQALPSNLTYLSVVNVFQTLLDDTPCDYSGLTQLKTLHASIDTLVKACKFPVGLEMLIGAQSAFQRHLDAFTNEQTLAFFQKLPPNLKKLHLLCGRVGVLNALHLRALSSRMTTLKLACTGFMIGNELFGALPRTLEHFDFRITSVDGVTAVPTTRIVCTHLASTIPPHLKTLAVHGCLLDDFWFMQPIPSLQAVLCYITPKMERQNILFETLFPNAHTSIYVHDEHAT